MSYHKWTKEEEKMLSNAVSKYGLNWSAINKNSIPNIDPICLKNKYYAVVHNIKMRQQRKQQMQLLQLESNKSDTNIQEYDDIISRIKMIMGQ
ncbi:Myb-like_DNA-binding domain-containing protein [Hexamita inflata]|uniref:Myb-like DNA-binding domain-containing protein n=1 Tax=Hexamita inflata TaxID=28002 RepID=A0AA86TYM1_9EUKA|nr:Myb-like DNA-binding domain-containing protein [Hexamita inflata]